MQHDRHLRDQIELLSLKQIMTHREPWHFFERNNDRAGLVAFRLLMIAFSSPARKISCVGFRYGATCPSARSVFYRHAPPLSPAGARSLLQAGAGGKGGQQKKHLPCPALRLARTKLLLFMGMYWFARANTPSPAIMGYPVHCSSVGILWPRSLVQNEPIRTFSAGQTIFTEGPAR